MLVPLTVEPTSQAAARAPSFPTLKGLNYGVPLTQSGDWVGTAWLKADRWPQVEPAIEADMAFVQGHDLGRVIRLFIGLDQMMNWDGTAGYEGFQAVELENLSEALAIFERRGMRVILVLFDQEVVGSPGNFRYEALDGRHVAMRSGYIRAVGDFLRWLRNRSAVAAVDLFNEAYSSLGTFGGLPRPPAPDPISPGYTAATVHGFLREIYAAARAANRSLPLTVSDATLYWQPQPELNLYDDILDFYDVHVYDDHPHLANLRRALDKPYLVGEAGAAVPGERFTDQPVEAPVVHSLLEQARSGGALALLVHSIASQNVFPATRDRLTPTGQVLSEFEQGSAGSTKPSVWPIARAATSLVSFVTANSAHSPMPGDVGAEALLAKQQPRWERHAQQPEAGGP